MERDPSRLTGRDERREWQNAKFIGHVQAEFQLMEFQFKLSGAWTLMGSLSVTCEWNLNFKLSGTWTLIESLSVTGAEFQFTEFQF